MRILFIIFLAAFIGFSCVKPKTKNPIPVIEFADFSDPHKTPRGDTATMVLNYEDGDGDLFVDKTSEGPNLIFTPYYYDLASKTYKASFNVIINDTTRITMSIKQPDNGYYKGKSIKGQIYVPLLEFRPNDATKIIRFSGFMVDLAGHKSNAVVSPSYTLNF